MNHSMHQTGVWKLEYPQHLKDAVSSTAQYWAEFCLLPNSVQNIFTTDNMFNGSGFERKTGAGGADNRFSSDKKMNFDITMQGMPALRDALKEIGNLEQQEIAERFIDALSHLVDEAPEVIEEFGKIIEDSLGVNDFRALSRNSAAGAFFRCLYYPPTQHAQEIIGEPHVDNSGFTLHLYESTDGCEALSSDTNSWYKMPVADGQALAFPSMQTQLYSEGGVDGLCHRILSNETTKEFGRIAIVCFVALDSVPSYDRERHGRLQQKDPGFNYGMDPGEFSKFFVM